MYNVRTCVDTRLFIHQLSVGRFYFFKKKALSLVTFCFLLRLILGHFFFVNAHERRSSFLYFCKRKNIHWSCKRKNIHTHTSTGARSEFYWTLDYSFISWRSVGSISLKKSSLLGHFVFCCVSSLVTFVFLSTHTNAGAHFCTFVNAKIYIRTRTSELVPNFTGHSIIHSSVVDRSVLFLLKKKLSPWSLCFLLRLILGHFFLLRLILGHFCFLLRLILGHFCFFVNAHERRSSFLYFCKRINIHWSCKRKNIHTHTNVGARSEFYWTLDYSFISCRSVGSISLKKKLSLTFITHPPVGLCPFF